jgi:ABC-2 type transport system permease protein
MNIWNITVKDLRLILQDRGALYTLLALPVAFIAILGVSTGQLITTHDAARLIKIGIVDETSGELGEKFFNNLASIGGIQAAKVSDQSQARMQLQDGRTNVVVILGNQFENRVDQLGLRDILDSEHGKLSQGIAALDIQVQTSAEFVAVSQLVDYIVLAAVQRVIAPDVARKNAIMRRTVDRILQGDPSTDGLSDAEPPLQPVKEASSIVYQTLVPGFMVMFAFFLINAMASSFISERQLGTLRRLKTSPIHPLELLVGKTVPFLIVSITQCTLLFLAGKVLFGMSWGTHPWMLLPVLFMTSVAATGLGLLIATIVQTESQITSYSTFVLIVLAGISGCYMPRAWLPELMLNASLATPHAWALIAYQELLTRDSPEMSLVIKCCVILGSFGLVYSLIGALRFRRMEYSH